ncbi:MAG: AAA family ATPase [Candidatus Levybacteria bacterium]|nr:AAA family ATPase [Candidatus Levybacteria bacterium]
MIKQSSQKIVLAFVGMPGAGKTEATAYLEKKGIPFVRFGDVTDEGLHELSLPLTPDNESKFREKIRAELGMAAYAIKAKSKLDSLLQKHDVIAIDGLYSWEEYVYLKNFFSGLQLIHIFAQPNIRYKRLIVRAIRPLSLKESRKRDITELEQLNKGGPIAIADYLIENNSDSLEELYKKIDSLLARLHIKTS